MVKKTAYSPDTSIAVIIPAAGFGTRMGKTVAKQFIEVGGKTILAHTVDKIQAWAATYSHQIAVMVALSEGAVLPDEITGVHTCVGGKTRADSVANALQAIGELGNFTWAMVHDAARPLVSVDDIETLYQKLKDDAVGGILAKKVAATVKRAEGWRITKTIARDNLWLAQTPQLFRFDLLQQSLSGQRTHLTDEASGIEAMGLQPKIISGGRENLKITTPEDLAYFEQLYLQSQQGGVSGDG
ncbi:MAG: 2-C-methyl-D-erythritol 4-phosphate cytidylyltransferase [Gammaproteobacteria bacterium]|nr:MAG: 2-C-methyl-D-erythritol 4-phosphate cytidylyltransferase [Gammaproteobacteria bacterium]